ncbi:pyruvate kinase [Hymenobacter koreensis]|uniref:pyruvate kinase n=1 Tax=Hymenobacter koreensis TaxID=1084523 RepID=UPI0031EE9B24
MTVDSAFLTSFAGQHAPELDELIAELTAVRQDMLRLAAQAADRLQAVHPDFQLSARNLLHYLALRRQDLRPLQQRLAALGLSSLGRAEAHALATVDAVLGVLHALRHPQAPVPEPPAEKAPDFSSGPRLLTEHSKAALGPAPAARGVRIMVTMPGEAATDYDLVHELLRHGMDCMRINCAHDDAAAWQQMIAHLRRAEQALGKSCHVSMDLAGPKLRTAGLPPAPAVLPVGPRRDAFGRILAPARLWLTAQEQPQPAPEPGTATLHFPATWLNQLQQGETIRLVDARGKKRKLRLHSMGPAGSWAELRKTAYLTPETRFQSASAAATPLGLPQLESLLLLHTGDRLRLTRLPLAELASLETPAIGCTLPEVLDYVQVGEAIWFDDGKIGGVVELAEPGTLLVRITRARAKGEKLRNDKGINLPDSQLPVSALTDKDRQDLVFAAQHADMVALSFARTVQDVEQLRLHLAQLTDRPLPIILKIETRQGFDNLPALLLSAMAAGSCGVMIARGDLAVECGFERMAEVQEEMLWLCEAAHVPVIWATQVLESLARGGLPSRAEITDAAMGDRAECVMLNKGTRVVEAVQTLSNILQRMQAHQSKKSPMLRRLHVAHALT